MLGLGVQVWDRAGRARVSKLAVRDVTHRRWFMFWA